jgi:hypothetical protein
VDTFAVKVACAVLPGVSVGAKIASEAMPNQIKVRKMGETLYALDLDMLVLSSHFYRYAWRRTL